MKDRIFTGFLTFLIFCAATPAHIAAISMTEINSIATESMQYTDQIRLGFNDLAEVNYHVDESNGACHLSLYNVPYTSAVAKNLARTIKTASRNITNVTLSKIASDNQSEEGSQLTIVFANNNIHLNVQNLEHPHQLIIEVTSNDLLQARLRGNGVIAHAFNKLHAHYAAQTLV